MRFFYIDLNNTNNDVRVSIREFKVKFILYQAFEIFIMLEIETFQRKKYNVDEMNLKKIKLIFIVMRITIVNDSIKLSKYLLS